MTQSHFASDITKAVQNRVFFRDPNAAQYIGYVAAFSHPDRTNALQNAAPSHSKCKYPRTKPIYPNILRKAPALTIYSIRKGRVWAKRRRAARASGLRIALSSAYNPRKVVSLVEDSARA